MKHKRCILITGCAGTGKDTVADYLIKKYGYKQFAVADPLKQIALILFNLPKDVTYYNKRHRKEKKIKGCRYSPRQIWQILGNKLRKAFYAEIYVDNILFRCKDESKVVISDVRYDNEFTYFKEHNKNAELWKVVRPNYIGNVGIMTNNKKHQSERGLSVKENHLLINDGTKKQLYKKIDELMK